MNDGANSDERSFEIDAVTEDVGAMSLLSAAESTVTTGPSLAGASATRTSGAVAGGATGSVKVCGAVACPGIVTTAGGGSDGGTAPIGAAMAGGIDGKVSARRRSSVGAGCAGGIAGSVCGIGRQRARSGNAAAGCAIVGGACSIAGIEAGAGIDGAGIESVVCGERGGKLAPGANENSAGKPADAGTGLMRSV
jgi:hypothetical protein